MVRVYVPEDAIRNARPLPRREDFVIEDTPEEEWTAFLEALAQG